MPYVKQERRLNLNLIVKTLHADEMYNFELKFILYNFCVQYIKPSYNNYKNFCGELRQCATEIERRKKVERLLVDDKSINCEVVKQFYNPIIKRKVKFLVDANLKIDGDLNYILYSLCVKYAGYLHKYDALYYSKFSQALRGCARRIEIDLLAPYEDLKIQENGDI